jgi:hypothetical protein
MGLLLCWRVSGLIWFKLRRCQAFQVQQTVIVSCVTAARTRTLSETVSLCSRHGMLQQLTILTLYVCVPTAALLQVVCGSPATPLPLLPVAAA